MRKISSIFVLLVAMFTMATSSYGEGAADSVTIISVQGDTSMVVTPNTSDTEALPQKGNGSEQTTEVTPQKAKKTKLKESAFMPDPKRATWYAIVCPGLGQIYNRSYWKLPILYGGALACTYLISWNGRMYNDYRNAYHDIIDSDPNTDSYMTLFPSYDGSQTWLPNTLRTKMNNYRRTRDMSVFAVVMLYMVSAVDAFVDAHLYDFTVSDDLSLRVEPIINSYSTDYLNRSRSFGFRCNITF
ncbi:MAG: hypothetical protein IKN77_09165 [Paludibacteraceae bacterium]|nr:hypothetical protein [Paludibacteraceae bacterium]